MAGYFVLRHVAGLSSSAQSLTKLQLSHSHTHLPLCGVLVLAGLLALSVVRRLAPRNDSLLLLSCFVDAAHLLDPDLCARDIILCAGQMLMKPVLNAPALRDSDAIVMTAFGQNLV
jgi:hypothetical protein